MNDAETLMKQAGVTAASWLSQAEEAVKDMNMSDDAKAHIIAAFIRSAAQVQHTKTIQALAEKGIIKNSGGAGNG